MKAEMREDTNDFVLYKSELEVFRDLLPQLRQNHHPELIGQPARQRRV